jgi:hypothetical protein
MTIVYFLNAIYNILSLFCRTNSEEFVIDIDIDDSPFTLRRTTSEEFVIDIDIDIDDSPFTLRRTTSEEFVINIDDSPFTLRRTTSEEFVINIDIDDLRRTRRTINTTQIKKPLFMTFFVDDIILPIQK